MHSKGKGISKSALPYRRTPPSWLKTTPSEVVDHVSKLARKGLTPSQIGVILRDSHGIAQVSHVTGSKIMRILKKIGLAPEIPEDLYCLIKKAVSVRKHLDKFRGDTDAKFRLILIESRIHRETDFSTYVYQCENYVETTPPPLDQDERLTVCLEPQQGGVSTDLVYIANFNLRLHAGSALDGNDVEYDPVWFGTDGYEYNQLTDVTSEPSGNIIMIKTPVVAGFYIKKHTTIDLDGNCFFEFESPSKEGMASIFGVFDMQVELLGTNQEGGCLTKLMSMIRNFF